MHFGTNWSPLLRRRFAFLHPWLFLLKLSYISHSSQLITWKYVGPIVWSLYSNHKSCIYPQQAFHLLSILFSFMFVTFLLICFACRRSLILFTFCGQNFVIFVCISRHSKTMSIVMQNLTIVNNGVWLSQKSCLFGTNLKFAQFELKCPHLDKFEFTFINGQLVLISHHS